MRGSDITGHGKQKHESLFNFFITPEFTIHWVITIWATLSELMTRADGVPTHYSGSCVITGYSASCDAEIIQVQKLAAALKI